MCWLIASLIAACGCDGPSTGPDAGGRDAEIRVDAGPGDAGRSPDSSVDGAETDGGRPLRSASFILSYERSGPVMLVVVEGGFYPDVPARPALEHGELGACPATASWGGCQLLDCAPPASVGGAGRLSVEMEGDEIFGYDPVGDDDYFGSTWDAFIDPGDAITFRLSGGVIPAISGTVVAPGAITASLPTSAPRRAPLTVTWSTTAPDDGMVLLLSTPSNRFIRCAADATDGSVTIAPELLARLPAGYASMLLERFDTELVTTGDYRVLLWVSESVRANVLIES
jgi:hypothetical protein